MPIVTLMPSDIAFADYVALWRQKRGDKLEPRTRAPTAWDAALALHILGARCEVAAYHYLRPVHWNPWKIGCAEFEDFIDAKGRSELWNDLIITQGTMHEDYAYLMVFAHKHPEYLIGKWCWGREIADRRYEERTPGRPAIFVPPSDRILKPPELLLAVLRERQRAKYGDLDKVWIGIEPEPAHE